MRVLSRIFFFILHLNAIDLHPGSSRLLLLHFFSSDLYRIQLLKLHDICNRFLRDGFLVRCVTLMRVTLSVIHLLCTPLPILAILRSPEGIYERTAARAKKQRPIL